LEKVKDERRVFKQKSCQEINKEKEKSNNKLIALILECEERIKKREKQLKDWFYII